MTYTPPNLKDWQHLVRVKAQETVTEMLDGAIGIEMWIYLHRPPSRPKKCLFPDRKPDWDNIAKAFVDAVKAVLLRDDNQVCDAHIYKRYAKEGRPPSVSFKVWRLGPEDV